MDLENEKIGPAYAAPDTYFKDTEMRLMQRLGIQNDIQALNVAVEPGAEQQKPHIELQTVAPLDTTGVQKRARKQDPITSKSSGINKELDALGNVVIPPLTFTTNENPEWVNFGAISEEVSASPETLNDQIKVVSYGDLLTNVESTDAALPASVETPMEEVAAPAAIPVPEITEVVETALPVIEQEPPVVVHEVPESVGLDELESYLTTKNPLLADTAPIPVAEVTPVNNAPQPEPLNTPRAVEERPISLEAPATAFAPIAGRQKESATPGWLGVAAALAAIVAAYFIWTAIQPPKLDTEEVVLQQEETTQPEAPLDEPVVTDTIPDGLQLVEPLIMEEMPKYKEPNVYTIIDAEEMPERTKRALQDLEDHNLATFDMEDELFEELDFESL